ncbi:transcription initiation factor TFIID subunit 9 [Nasonia vitripennis]|uniref:Transcription initiation factor TFIID subunit 9 n=1 Tax=Nasonia vitripennis TaxID=7425 RepID=A0A7M7LNP5_NASVI|nr:transcription initiation factor TFIID subunit 9 [Nasonia vitripennis]XP_003426480.1 transcription initiation factor TFIID subunit 9 [Nasonia vitripennis]XP_008207484.1 transcription initiation factor TFIID subunit 9 [Nasonia vitripennis]XP_032456923.1 transcription initiation factor TFIID subunit 9 [Nasonia vitripennis]
MAEKPKLPSHVKHVPKDAQVIVSIMKDMGITDYEPKVINQLLEFTYRYVTCILDDSKIYANHSKKKFIDLEDVRLAVKLQLDRTFTNPPPRDVLIEVAKAKNSIPLPFVKPNNGLRLPPDRYCLNGTNYKLKSPVKKSGKVGFGNAGSFGSQSRGRMEHKGYSIVKRPGTLATVARTQTISMSKPVYKFSTGTTANSVKSQPSVQTPMQVTISEQNQSSIKTEPEDPIKTKKEEENYDVT